MELTDPIFRWVQGEGAEGCTSTLTLTELLVQPYRHCDQQRVDEFFALITAYPNLTWIPPDLSIAAVAARIRAAHRLRTPDAVQAATALHVGATGLISNDAAFAKWSSVEVLLLDHLL